MASTANNLNTEQMADQAARSADNAIRSTQRVANEALEGLADRVQQVREDGSARLSQLSSEAERMARRSLDAVRDNAAMVRERAARVSDSTVGYIRDEPMKALLIAAATGAALMALVSLMSRSRD